MRFYYKEDIFKLVKGRLLYYLIWKCCSKTKSLVDNYVKFIADNTKIYGELPTKMLKFKILTN